jgi:tetratricopeptide (TPR) repeat protein
VVNVDSEEVSVQGQPDAAQTNLNILDLASILQSLSQNRRTGTLKVTRRGDESALFYMRDGLLRLASASSPDINLLEEAMLKFRRLSRPDLDEARQAYVESGESMIGFFAHQERLDERELKGQLASLVFERGAEVLFWKDVHCEFFPERLLEPDLSSELADFGQVTPVDGILLEAARRADEWERIQQAFDPNKEVFELVRELPEHLTSPVQRELAAMIDGDRDVSELADASGYSLFHTSAMLLEMVGNGYIQARSADQLMILGSAASAQGNWRKALKLYQRAGALDRKRVDVPERLAAAYEALGDLDNAKLHLEAMAKDRIAVSKFADAARACRKLVEIAPDEVEHRARLFKCLQETDDRDELSAVGRKLVLLYEEQGILDRALEVLAKLKKIFDDDAELVEIDARIRLATAERTEALIEYEKLADSYIAKGELENAIRTFRKIVEEIDEECLEARLQMAECLIQLERIDEAVAEYTKLADILMRTGVFDAAINVPFVLKVHRRVAELDPGNTSSREWLAESFAKQGNRDQAISEFDELMSIHQSAENRQGLVATLQRVADLFPDVLHYREWLAECYLEEEGGRDKAKPEFQELLRAAWQQEDFETGVRVAERLLELEPFYMEAHVLLGESLLGKGDKPAALEKMLSVAMMYMGAGMIKEAKEVLVESLEYDSNNVDAHRFLAAVLEERGSASEAARHYKFAGLLSLEAENFGSARNYLELARDLGSSDSEIEEALGRLSPGSSGNRPLSKKEEVSDA